MSTSPLPTGPECSGTEKGAVGYAGGQTPWSGSQESPPTPRPRFAERLWPGRTCFHCPRPQGERATGFGVALLLALFGRASEDPLLNLVSPLGCEVDVQEEDAERDSKKRRLV